MPARSAELTWRTVPAENFGRTVTANSVLRVLAGASLRCGLFAASTLPVSASATIQDRALRPLGSLGIPGALTTCTPAPAAAG